MKTSLKRGVHRRRRPRRPLPGMLLHRNGSSHTWFQDERRYDLPVILDDATNEIYYAQLVEEESTATVMIALRKSSSEKALSVRCTAIAPTISSIRRKRASRSIAADRHRWAGHWRNCGSR